jgi:hypothetical protein
MPTKRKKDPKDFARKQTLNAPGKVHGNNPGREENDQLERENERDLGQFSGGGRPPLIKK